MNLMFRKNFTTEKTISSSGGGGKARGALGAGRNAKRRDRERFSCMEEPHHYKTHIFFSAAPRTSTQYNDGGVSLLRWDRGPTVTVPDRRRTEPVSLATLEKDCFTAPNALSILEIADPKHCILAHLMSPLEPIEPILESPLTKPLFKQRSAAAELVSDVANANTAVGGMLLANMERNAEFPFIAYYVINTQQTDPLLFYNNMRCASLNKFDPKTIRYSAAHTLDLYSEVAMICRPPVGMRKIALHKSVAAHGDKMYLLVCECANLMDNLSGAAMLITALRARLC
ncbi:Uncharacterized protein OBRU01_20797, partial [Operophtera brumata]